MFTRRYFPGRYFPERYFPEEGLDVVLEDGLRETVGLSDRLGGLLVPALLSSPRERIGLSDRLTSTLVDSISVVMRETLGLSDRLSGNAFDAITQTMRETIGLSDRVSADQQAPYILGTGMLVLAHLYFDEGQENYSGHKIGGSSHSHQGKIISFGSILKECEVPAGSPRLSDMTVEFTDHDQYWRKKLGAKTPRLRKADFRIGPKGGKEHLFQKPATMTIQHATFPPERMRLQGTDLSKKWLEKPLPMVINSANYANLPVGTTEKFFPFGFGIKSAPGVGVVEAHHVDTVRHMYSALFHPMESATVYTQTPDQQTPEISPYSWSLVQEPLILEGRVNNATYIQFASALPEGTKVTFDYEGVNFRGAWGTLPTELGVSRNLVDHTINILYYIKRLDEPEPDFSDYEVNSFAEVREKVSGILSDYAITEPITGHEIITQLHQPAVVYMVTNHNDQIKLVKITDADLEDAPEINDFDGLLENSELISLASPTYNQYVVRFDWNPATQQFNRELVFDNTADQEVLGEVEQLRVDFYSISDEDVALECIAERAVWEDHEAHRAEVELDAPTNLVNIDMLKPIKWTHGGGLADGGWVQEFFIPYYVELDLDRLVFRVRWIRRTIVQNPQNQIGVIGDWTRNSRVGPEYLATVRRLYLWFADTRAGNRKIVVMGTNSDGVIIPIDDGIYPTLDNEIGSHDGLVVGVLLHVWTQEKNTGRAAYSRFNGATGLYEILDAEILASNSHGDYGITGDVQDPSGKVTVMLQGDREFSSGFPPFPSAAGPGFYQRAYVTVRQSNGTWSTPVMMGNPNDAFASFWFPFWGDPHYMGTVHIQTGRAKSGYHNRVHFAFSRVEPGDVAVTPDFLVQTLRTDGTLSDSYEFEMTGGGGGGALSSDFLVGEPCRFTDENGQTWIVFPIGKLAEPKLAFFKDVDNPTVPDRSIVLSTTQVQPDTFGARWAPIGVRELEGSLLALHGTRGATEWAALKTIDEPFDSSEAAPSYTANPRDVVAGAIFGTNDYARSGFDAKRLRDGQKYLFKVTSGNFGIAGTVDGKWILERLNVAELPTSYTLAEFVAANP